MFCLSPKLIVLCLAFSSELLGTSVVAQSDALQRPDGPEVQQLVQAITPRHESSINSLVKRNPCNGDVNVDRLQRMTKPINKVLGKPTTYESDFQDAANKFLDARIDRLHSVKGGSRASPDWQTRFKQLDQELRASKLREDADGGYKVKADFISKYTGSKNPLKMSHRLGADPWGPYTEFKASADAAASQMNTRMTELTSEWQTLAKSIDHELSLSAGSGARYLKYLYESEHQSLLKSYQAMDIPKTVLDRIDEVTEDGPHSDEAPFDPSTFENREFDMDFKNKKLYIKSKSAGSLGKKIAATVTTVALAGFSAWLENLNSGTNSTAWTGQDMIDATDPFADTVGSSDTTFGDTGPFTLTAQDIADGDMDSSPSTAEDASSVISSSTSILVAIGSTSTSVPALSSPTTSP